MKLDLLPRFEVRQAVSDVVHEEPVEGLGEVGRPVSGGEGGVLPLEERRLVLHRVLDTLVVLDVLLGPEKIRSSCHQI